MYCTGCYYMRRLPVECKYKSKPVLAYTAGKFSVIAERIDNEINRVKCRKNRLFRGNGEEWTFPWWVQYQHTCKLYLGEEKKHNRKIFREAESCKYFQDMRE